MIFLSTLVSLSALVSWTLANECGLLDYRTQAVVTSSSLNTSSCSKDYLFDNRTRDNSPDKAVFCSSSDSRTWVQVDLGRETYIRQVVLHPRKGHEDRLNHVYVRVGSKSEDGTPLGQYASKNRVCGRYSGVKTVETPREFKCYTPFKGRYITIQRYIVGPLDMSEIEIDADPYGIIPETCDPNKCKKLNLKNARVTSNSIHGQCGLGYLFDGKSYSESPDFEFYCSDSTRYPRIQIDLGRTTTVSSITIYAHKGFEDRIAGVTARVGQYYTNHIRDGAILPLNLWCKRSDLIKTDSMKTLKCSRPLSGRFVTLQRTVIGQMDISEVTMDLDATSNYGDDCHEDTCAGVNYRQNAVVTSSGLVDGCSLNRLFDGIKNSSLTAMHYCSTNDRYDWVQIDLGRTVKVKGVRIYPRVTLEDRANSIKVRVGQVSAFGTPSGRWTPGNLYCGRTANDKDNLDAREVKCTRPIEGRYINFQRVVVGYMDFSEIELDLEENIPTECQVKSCEPLNYRESAVPTSNGIDPSCSFNAIFNGERTGTRDSKDNFCTNSPKFIWLQIDLRRTSKVFGVTLFPRMAFKSRFSNIVVEVGNTPITDMTVGKIINGTNQYCSQTSSEEEAQNLRCSKPLYGRYVTFQRSVEGPMDISEINLDLDPHYGIPAECNVKRCDSIDYRLNSVVKSNELSPQCDLDHLFDGKTASDSPGNDYYCSYPNKEPWLQVDLTRQTMVKSATMHPRLRFESRITKVEIRVGPYPVPGVAQNKVCGVSDSTVDKDKKQVVCSPALMGRYIQFRRFDGLMYITELEFDLDTKAGLPADCNECPALPNVLDNKIRCNDPLCLGINYEDKGVVTSNERFEKCGVDKLFDGKKTTDSQGYDYYCSWPNKEPWLQIDLTQEASIRSVTIHPRRTYEAQINDVHIYIGNNAVTNFAKNKLCGTTDSVMDKGVKTVTCKDGPVKGRYVQFKREGYMDITELEFEFGCDNCKVDTKAELPGISCNDPLCVGVQCDKKAVGKSNKRWPECGVDKLFDGKKTADSPDYDYYCSWPNEEPWLQIDLTQEASIRSVTIHPRKNFETRITNVQVYIGNNAIANVAKNKLCGTTDSVMDKGVKTVTCKDGPVKGRFVQFKREGVMDITELEFDFGCNDCKLPTKEILPALSCDDPLCSGAGIEENALGRSNKRWPRCGVDKLFDGKKTADSPSYDYYCSWPNEEPWLQIDLTRVTSIRGVTIYPRKNYESRITNVVIRIGAFGLAGIAKNKLCGSSDDVLDKGFKTVICNDGPIQGRYVHFKRAGIMDITELEFNFGCDDCTKSSVSSPSCGGVDRCSGVNYKRNAWVTSNSVAAGSSLGHLFDGRTRDNSPATFDYTSTSQNHPWVQIDLRRQTTIRSVTLYVRANLEGKINNVQVRVGNKPTHTQAGGALLYGNALCGTTNANTIYSSKQVTCSPHRYGRYITIQRSTQGLLSFTEVSIDLDDTVGVPQECFADNCDIWDYTTSAVVTSNNLRPGCTRTNLFDGRTRQNSPNYKFFCTNNYNYPWVQIDLKQGRTLRSVTIHPRKDFEFRITNLQVRIGNTPASGTPLNALLTHNALCGTTKLDTVAESQRLTCPSGQNGRYITLQRQFRGNLDITEVVLDLDSAGRPAWCPSN